MSERPTSLDRSRPDLARHVVRALVVLIALAGMVIGPGIASAHTGFESSTPATGDAIDQPVDLVTVVFTGEATPVGDRFIALTPAGALQEPANIDTVDNRIFSVRFDPPLAGGEVGIRWNVQAADAHPIEGAFSFIVNAAAVPAITPAPTIGASSAPSSTSPAATAASPDLALDADTAAGAAVVDAPSPPSAAGVDAPVAESTTGTSVQPAQSLDDFLTVDGSTPGETTATIGRLVGFVGVVLGVGALAFVTTALRGRRGEIRRALAVIRLLGAVIVVGAAIEYVGVARTGSQSLVTNWSTAPGFATVLRMVGGAGLAVGLAGTISRGRVQRVVRRPSVVRSLSAAVVDDVRTAPVVDEIGSPIVRWSPDARSWPSLGGVVLIIVSFWFDGHTVTKGFRPVHAMVNSVHVVAGSVWVGGVVALSTVAWSRYRSGEAMRIVELVVRFSKIAAIALASVIVAGGVMAWLVLDSFGELTGTQWGKILLLKTAAVAIAMTGAAYNHYRLLPALETDPDSPELLAELRSTVTAEAIMLVFVVIVTAWLVSAAS